MSSTKKKIAALEKMIKILKIKDQKPKKISDCTTKEELKYFTVKELTEYIKKNKINVKKINEKHKKDFIKIVWEYLDTDSEYDSDSSTSDYSESDSSDSDSD